MKKNIGVFFGGQSVEHDISIITAMQVIALLEESYNVIPVYMTKENEFYSGELKKIQTFLKPDFLKTKNVFKVAMTGKNLYRFRNLALKPYLQIDVAFNCCHGGIGEDGGLQGFFETNNVCYTGADVVDSAVFMDKFKAKQILRQNGFNVVSGERISKSQWENSESEIIEKYSGEKPYIVKPCRLGSSIGISKVSCAEELKAAFDIAFKYDEFVLIEEFLNDCKECCCACLTNGSERLMSDVESVDSPNELYTFEDKYVKSGSKQSKKAKCRIPKQICEKIRGITAEIAVCFDIGGVFRVDYLIFGKEIYICEINTLPGSMALNLFKGDIAGLKVLEYIIDDSVKSFERKKEFMKSFDSSVLYINENNNFGSKGCGKS